MPPSGINRFDGAASSAPGWHAHDGGQFILVESGVSHLRTEDGAWVIAARRVAWVPPGVRHMSRSSRGGRGWVVISPVELRSRPQSVCVLRASALLIASLQRIAQSRDRDVMRRLLWRVVDAELNETPHEPLGVPMPTASRMLEAAERVLARPTAAASLDKLAASAGMSRRSFARHFRSETGLPYSRWRRAVIAQHALELVAAGHKVSSVAIDVGYESVSAFIAMFRRQYGESPRQFLVENSEWYPAPGVASRARGVEAEQSRGIRN